MEFAIGIAGLLLALYQIRRAERAAIAARNAVIDTSSNVNQFSFLLLVPELALIERDLERAAAGDKKEETLRLLREWRTRASEMRGLLAVHDLAEDQLAQQVQTSIAQATLAYGAISKGKPVGQSSQRARKTAGDVVLLARSEGERVRASIRPPREVTTMKDDLIALLRRVGSGKPKKELEQ